MVSKVSRHCRWLLLGSVLCATVATARSPEASLNPVFMEAEAYPEFAAALADARWDQAIGEMRGILRAMETGYGPEHPALVPALVNLGTARHQAGQPAAAMGDFQRAVDILTSQGDNRHPDLIRPLRGLGRAALSAGDYPAAIRALSRAAFIGRVAYGLHDPAQLAPYDGLVAAQLAVGREDEAARLQRSRLAVIESGADGRPGEMAAALGRTAAWFNTIGRHADARELQRERLEVLREARGDEHPALVPALIGVADTYQPTLQEPAFAGLDALHQALAIQQDASPRDPGALAGIRLALGDFYMRFDRPRNAVNEYRKARALYGEAGDAEALERLRAPTVAYLPPIRRLQAVPDAGLGIRVSVRLKLDVDVRGKPGDVEVVSVDPPRLAELGESVRRAHARARMRPRLTADGAVSAENVSLVHEFHYLPGPSG